MRYFFHYRSANRSFTDPEGGDFANLAAAVEDSQLSARELMGLDHGQPDRSFASGVFEIASADGTILAVTDFGEVARRAG